jgi:hypothetical protein
LFRLMFYVHCSSHPYVLRIYFFADY